MYLYANGCSMTYGSELHDDPATGVCTDHEYRWRYSWPGQLRGLVDADGAYNDAVPSGSNDRILRTTVDFVTRWSRLGLPSDALLVVVGWSHPARREFFVAGEYRQVVPHHYYDLRPLDRLVARYRAAATADEEAADRYATQVAVLSGFLHQQRVSYLFFNGITAPGDDTEPTMVEFLRDRPDTMHDQHPNETGHRLWARRLAERIDPAAFGSARGELPVLGGTRVAHRHDRKGAERLGRFVRTRRRLRPGDRSDPFIYP